VRSSVPSSISVQFVTRQDLPPLFADASQVEQIIMNLLINAVEAIPSGRKGRILVRTDLEHIAHPIAGMAGEMPPGDYLVLAVRDDGCGMDEATRARIFDPFYTTKFTGRGLGLAAVQGILRNVGGAAVVESSPDHGASFKILLPPSGTAGAQKVVEIDDARNAPPLKVLGVDDEEIIRKVAKTALQSVGHEVHVAATGEEAIHVLRRGESFSLMLLDMGMPQKSGTETLLEIRAAGSDVPVILCSGYSEPEMRRQSEGLTVAGYLQKPYTAQTLRDKVASCVKTTGRAVRTRSAG